MIGTARRVAVAFGALVLLAACEVGPDGTKAAAAADSVMLAARVARLRDLLAHPDSLGADKPLARWNLPAVLAEESGLALTADGRLLTHGDSRGKIVEVDFRRGIIVKEFMVGDPVVHGDFEAITMMGDEVLLMASDGVIYRFPEGAKGKSVTFTTYDTGLGDRCEFESMAYDAKGSMLLLACKKVHVKSLKDSLVIFRVPVAAMNGGAKPATAAKITYIAVPMARIIGSNGWPTLHPSDLAINPFNGNYIIVASIEKALFEITPSGDLVFARPLPPNHEQAEGVALTKDSILIIGDEAKGGAAALTLYRWREKP